MRNFEQPLTKAYRCPPPSDARPSAVQRHGAGHFIAAYLSAYGAVVIAAPAVIHDSGQTVPIAQFLAPAFTKDQRPGGPLAHPVAPDPRHAQLPVTFPVRTPSMRPGALQQNQTLRLQSWLPTPVFLIGTDEFSRQWVVRNRDLLARQKAAGIVIDAENLAAFRAIQQVGQGLPMAPSSAEDLAKRLRLSVYPVLIRTDGVIVQ